MFFYQRYFDGAARQKKANVFSFLLNLTALFRLLFYIAIILLCIYFFKAKIDGRKLISILFAQKHLLFMSLLVLKH